MSERDDDYFCEECLDEGCPYCTDDASFGPDYDYGDSIEFADPTGHSALRAATPTNPRNLPCPTCGSPNRLTPLDVQLGYQCDTCADRAEAGLDLYY